MVKAGFKEPDALVLDGVRPYHHSAGILASPAIETTKPTKVTLLCYSAEGPYVAEMKSTLNALDTEADIAIFGESYAPRQDVISLLDLQEPLVHALTEQTFSTLVGHLKSLDSKLVWVTRASQVACEDPRSAMTLGLARSARSELSIKLFTVEIDSTTSVSAATDAVSQLLIRFQSEDSLVFSMDPDWEYAVVGGEVLIPRLHWKSMSNAFATSQTDVAKSSVKGINVRTPGLLHTMEWTESERPTLGEGQVVVQTKAIGLNFRVSFNSYTAKISIANFKYRMSSLLLVFSTTAPARLAWKAVVSLLSLVLASKTWLLVTPSSTCQAAALPPTSPCPRLSVSRLVMT